jgi:hypothetical protein
VLKFGLFLLGLLFLLYAVVGAVALFLAGGLYGPLDVENGLMILAAAFGGWLLLFHEHVEESTQQHISIVLLLMLLASQIPDAIRYFVIVFG